MATGSWISMKYAPPLEGGEFLIWVVGGPIHLGEDYAEVATWLPQDRKFVTEFGEKIYYYKPEEISHWARIFPPK